MAARYDVLRNSLVRISLLGPIRAWGPGGVIALGSAQLKAVLAVFAMQIGRSISKSELMDALWGEEPPASARGRLYTHISALRASLEPNRAPRSEGTLLTSAGSGYCLTLPVGAVDVESFQQLREEARACRNNRDTAGELAALDAALSLWNGDALADVPGPFAARQRARLVELKLDAVERRARIMLNAGRPQALVDDLHELTREHPLREALHGLLMQALYLTGRRPAAIGVFQRLRNATVENLGSEPGSTLTTLYDKIVRDDVSLRWTVDGVPGLTRPIPLGTKPVHVRKRLYGREREVASLQVAAAAVVRGTGGVVWIEGEQGIGKTAVLEEGLADTGGCQSAWATADELSQAVPLRALMDGLDVMRLSPDPRRAEPAVAVRDLGPDQAAASVLTLVRRLCADGPLILVVDQLQWADPLSLLVLRRLAPETACLPLLVVVALRPLPRRSELDLTRAVLHQEAPCQVLTLGALPDDAVNDLVAGLAGAPPTPELQALAQQAAGNPWLLQALLQFMMSIQAIVYAEGQARLRGVKPSPNQCVIADVIADHMQTVPEDVRDLLGWAALCGEAFSAAEIAAAVGVPEVSNVLDDAATGGYLVKSGGQYSFRHKMIQRAFYGRYASAIRGSLHHQLAQAWAGIGAPPERVAEQLILASVDISPWLSEWLSANGAALSVRAPQLASTLLRRVIASDSISAELKESLTALLTTHV